MGTAAAMRAYLRDIIGVSDPPERRKTVREKGLKTVNDLIEFDDDGTKILCSSVQKPGGTIVDPSDATQRISNPGFSISAICENCLKWAAYGAQIYSMLGRNIEAANLDRTRLR